MEIELEDWLFDTTASPERREAEAQFVYGHLLKPGDIARTDWRLRCAQPPYDRLPIPRAKIPAGVILSREGDAWIWEDRIEDIALPLYEGRMIGQFDFSEKGWVSGKGRGAVWRDIPRPSEHLEPQYLMCHEHHKSTGLGPKLAIMNISSSTNSRTMVVSVVAAMPCGHSIGVLRCFPSNCVPLSAVLNSFVYDFALRVRFSGLNASWFILAETPLLPADNSRVLRRISRLSTSMGIPRPFLSRFPISLGASSARGVTDHEQMRRRIVLDVLIATAFGLGSEELHHVLHSCDLPRSTISDAQLNSKGFWRVDKEVDPELRHTVLTLIGFRELESKIKASDGNLGKGIKAFLAQNHGEGWMLPETLRLADLSLGHDDHAKHPQPVASRLGPRFYDWQLVQTADESWRECHLHARNLLGAREYRQLGSVSSDGLPEDFLSLVADPRAGYGKSERGQRSLFSPRTKM